MNITDYNFKLNENTIAKYPNKKRDKAKLLVVNKQTQTLQQTTFSQIYKYLNKGDCLVLNNTHVFPARLYARPHNKEKYYEFLLVKQKKDTTWEVLIKKRKNCKIGENFIFNNNKLKCTLIAKLESGNNIVNFNKTLNYQLLEKIGQAAIPPYILKLRPYKKEDINNYQTIYNEKIQNNKIQGSIAAPTAGLHFTQKLIQKLKNNGVNIAFITLNISTGTFKTIKSKSIQNHKMQAEEYIINKINANKINQTIKNNKRIIAVGTTSTRTLEHSFNNNKIKYGTGNTKLFIYPGYKFNVVNSLITNFHLPKSTPLLLVSALAGKKLIKKAYNYAIENQFSFYSYGDAMIII